MFKNFVRKNYRGCCSKEDYYNIRRDLDNFKKEYPGSFQKELNNLSLTTNPFVNIVLGISREKSIKLGKFVLTTDKYNSNHYLLLPKDLKYFNVLTLTKEDIPLLLEMKRVIECFFISLNEKEKNWQNHISLDVREEKTRRNNVENEYVLFFHVYPFNSIHTLHLHIVKRISYIAKKNDLLIDDVIYVLANENKILLGYLENQNHIPLLKDWFSTVNLNILNIYIAALILITNSPSSEILINEKNKSDYISNALDLVLDYLEYDLKDLQNKIERGHIYKYILEEKETLDSLTGTLSAISKKPYLLNPTFNIPS